MHRALPRRERSGDQLGQDARPALWTAATSGRRGPNVPLARAAGCGAHEEHLLRRRRLSRCGAPPRDLPGVRRSSAEGMAGASRRQDHATPRTPARRRHTLYMVRPHHSREDARFRHRKFRRDKPDAPAMADANRGLGERARRAAVDHEGGRRPRPPRRRTRRTALDGAEDHGDTGPRGRRLPRARPNRLREIAAGNMGAAPARPSAAALEEYCVGVRAHDPLSTRPRRARAGIHPSTDLRRYPPPLPTSLSSGAEGMGSAADAVPD